MKVARKPSSRRPRSLPLLALFFAAVCVVGYAALSNTGIAAPPANEEKTSERVSSLLSEKFPQNKEFSRPRSNGTFYPDTGPRIIEGKGELKPREPGTKRDTSIILDGIGCPRQFGIAQLLFDFEAATMYLKPVTTLKAELQILTLEDVHGSVYLPTGYMILKGENLKFELDPKNKIQNIARIPDLDSMKKGETIHFVFQLPRGVKVVKFTAGDKSRKLELTIP